MPMMMRHVDVCKISSKQQTAWSHLDWNRYLIY